jgi:hypothetical protein
MRGAAREREEEDSFGWNAAFYQVRDTVDERSGFAGAGSRDDEQRAIDMRGSRGLFAIQLGGEIARWFGDDSFARRIEPKIIGHGAI